MNLQQAWQTAQRVVNELKLGDLHQAASQGRLGEVLNPAKASVFNYRKHLEAQRAQTHQESLINDLVHKLQTLDEFDLAVSILMGDAPRTATESFEHDGSADHTPDPTSDGIDSAKPSSSDTAASVGATSHPTTFGDERGDDDRLEKFKQSQQTHRVSRIQSAPVDLLSDVDPIGKLIPTTTSSPHTPSNKNAYELLRWVILFLIAIVIILFFAECIHRRAAGDSLSVGNGIGKRSGNYPSWPTHHPSMLLKP